MTAKDLPLYRCHKTVRALKIAKVTIKPRFGATITPADERFEPFDVDETYLNKHKPREGGYYVVYTDGYASFSPPRAFEEGYTLIGSLALDRHVGARTEKVLTELGSAGYAEAIEVLEGWIDAYFNMREFAAASGLDTATTGEAVA